MLLKTKFILTALASCALSYSSAGAATFRNSAAAGGEKVHASKCTMTCANNICTIEVCVGDSTSPTLKCQTKVGDGEGPDASCNLASNNVDNPDVCTGKSGAGKTWGCDKDGEPKDCKDKSGNTIPCTPPDKRPIEIEPIEIDSPNEIEEAPSYAY